MDGLLDLLIDLEDASVRALSRAGPTIVLHLDPQHSLQRVSTRLRLALIQGRGREGPERLRRRRVFPGRLLGHRGRQQQRRQQGVGRSGRPRGQGHGSEQSQRRHGRQRLRRRRCHVRLQHHPGHYVPGRPRRRRRSRLRHPNNAFGGVFSGGPSGAAGGAFVGRLYTTGGRVTETSRSPARLDKGIKNNMPASTSALIEIGNLFAWIRPADSARLVLPALRCSNTRFVQSGSRGFAKQRQMEPFFQWENNDSLRILVGHVGRVRALLEGAGRTVILDDQRQFSVKAAPSMPVVEATRGEAQCFLEVLAREPRGLIEVPKQADVLHLTALICRLFPAARIYVPVATRKQVARTRGELQRILRTEVNVYEDYPWPWEGGRLVCTLKTFNHRNLDDVDIVVCPDASATAVLSHREAFGILPGQRVYGFVRTGRTFSAPVRLQLEGLFGSLIYRTPDPHGRRASVQVHWCLPPCCPPAKDATALQRNRRVFWHNDLRNDLISALADAFRSGARETLWQHGLLLGDEDILQVGTTRSVAILVESVEQGRELCRCLPGWELWDAVPRMSQAENPSAQAQSVWNFGVLDRVIVTLARASRLETVCTDVLVVASGQGWPDALPGFPPRISRGEHPVVLVDLADDCDADARQATLRRHRAYTGRGWLVAHAPAWMQQMS